MIKDTAPFLIKFLQDLCGSDDRKFVPGELRYGVLYPVEIKKGIAPSKPTKNFNVLAKYNMPIKQGMVIDNAEKIRVLNDDAFVLPVSLLGY